MENKQHGILDTLKHLAFEDEPESANKPMEHPVATAPVPTPAAVAPAPMSTPVVSTVEAANVAGTDGVYKRLAAKTDFDKTEAGATIRKFLEPLSAISDTVMPPNVKFKTAVVQAKAQSGLTEDSILSCFEGLKAQLQQEQQSFTVKAQQFEQREVAGRQERINQVTAQITQLQEELSKLSVELVDAQGKGARAQAQFSAALQRRVSEIEQQKAQYAALLKG
ncbi:hypothetical protein Acid345_4323 [Candidatus Koribacter versatilis Ellin345]|uniref:Uncharacterized protein n=1 Tax=Koribacter versatilis (strain Ellin345) TaxID=204669 RepID=Q1IIH7_KORVE|nr:hypothetical protein [Candidatus Koribacter versatilis]ABF43323.1 hypothetical protein Acid345_4323 [Candidatus Koribacter versatilis Ellin345]